MSGQRCAHYWAPYCQAHDYDHVLERREASQPAPEAPVAIGRHGIVATSEGLVAEASTLGLRGFPQQLAAPTREGGRMIFTLLRIERDGEGDITEALYTSAAGQLAVLND